MRVVAGRIVRETKTSSVVRERVIIPREATPRCQRYVQRILTALPHRCASADDREDRAAALVIAAVSEIAQIVESDRADFVRATLNAIVELLPKTIAANNEQTIERNAVARKGETAEGVRSSA